MTELEDLEAYETPERQKWNTHCKNGHMRTPQTWILVSMGHGKYAYRCTECRRISLLVQKLKLAEARVKVAEVKVKQLRAKLEQMGRSV